MKRILSAHEMKSCDENTINNHAIPSLILMERAALCVGDIIKSRFSANDSVIGVFCGCGNNGGDGVALARLLHLAGYEVKVAVFGKTDHISQQTKEEINIAKSYGICVDITDRTEALDDFEKCNVLVDALFGIGLSRNVEGIYKTVIDYINLKDAYKVAVDIPSGICADTGKMLGAAVKADMTVTFAYMKKGLLLSQGYINSGQRIVVDVGIYLDKEDGAGCYYLEQGDLKVIPTREVNANKGSCGKILVIAGSEQIYGACYLSAKAALVTGAGLVKIYTHVNNRTSIQQMLPEAMCTSYDEYDRQKLLSMIEWADAIVIGPGLSTDNTAGKILKDTLLASKVPVVIDADGINLLSQNVNLLNSVQSTVILTPHLKEMSRLCGKEVDYIKDALDDVASDFAKKYHCIIDLKNFTSYISVMGDRSYINTAGNEAMATPGSGDVLAGIIGSLIAQGIDPSDAVALGAYIHGSAGEAASKETGIRGLLAGDIIRFISV